MTDALAALVADAERQLSAPLALLSSAVQDGAPDPGDHLNAAANHITCALNRLAHTTPARQGSNRAGSGLGGPVRPSEDSGGVRAGGPPAPGAGDDFAVGSADCGFSTPQPPGPPRFEPGEDRLYGRVRPVSMGDGGLSGALEARWRS